MTEERYEKLSQQYIAFIQVGGAYAYNYRKLINLLSIKTLIITDLDYNKKYIKPDEIEDSEITNSTINNFYCECNNVKPKVRQLYAWSKEGKNILDNNLIYVAYQTDYDSYARTLEEAMLGKCFGISVEAKLKRSEWIKKRDESNLRYSIPDNEKKGEDSEFSLRDIIKSTSGEKTDFMYSVILNKLVTDMEPKYINEGLAWLMK